MIQVTSKLDLDSEYPTGQPIPMTDRSGREAEFQEALNRYMVYYAKQQALPRPGTSRVGEKLHLQSRIAGWLN